jgi:hypothetical protein
LPKSLETQNRSAASENRFLLSSSTRSLYKKNLKIKEKLCEEILQPRREDE